jgi:hypothetical protein
MPRLKQYGRKKEKERLKQADIHPTISVILSQDNFVPASI